MKSWVYVHCLGNKLHNSRNVFHMQLKQYADIVVNSMSVVEVKNRKYEHIKSSRVSRLHKVSAKGPIDFKCSITSYVLGWL